MKHKLLYLAYALLALGMVALCSFLAGCEEHRPKGTDPFVGQTVRIVQVIHLDNTKVIFERQDGYRGGTWVFTDEQLPMEGEFWTVAERKSGVHLIFGERRPGF